MQGIVHQPQLGVLAGQVELKVFELCFWRLGVGELIRGSGASDLEAGFWVFLGLDKAVDVLADPQN